MIPVYVGFDARETAAYHVFCQSVIQHSKSPVTFTPLALRLLKDYDEVHSDGSNAFIYSRFRNHLVGEQEYDPEAKLVHYTLGVPAIQAYAHCDYSKEWFDTLYETRSVTA
jgi:hypothetical protein